MSNYYFGGAYWINLATALATGQALLVDTTRNGKKSRMQDVASPMKIRVMIVLKMKKEPDIETSSTARLTEEQVEEKRRRDRELKEIEKFETPYCRQTGARPDSPLSG